MNSRSGRWLLGDSEVALSSRVALRSIGLEVHKGENPPVIGIANSASDLNPCNVPLRLLGQAVRAGIEAAGGLPVEFPIMSLGEDLMKPTAMLYRNLLAIEVEEMIRANPLDAVVLLANCDKTVPGVIMGAASADLPCIVVTGGSRPAACFAGSRVGTGTDLWRYWDLYRSGDLDEDEWSAFEEAISVGLGACNTMGTASTMAILTEVLGLSMPGSATIEAGGAASIELARQAGERSVALAIQNTRPSEFLTRSSFENAIKVLSAIGGSTNAVIHLTAIAGRTNTPIDLRDFDALGASVPVVVDVEPTGKGLIGDFSNAGGVPTLLAAIAQHLELDLPSVSGKTLQEIADGAGEVKDPIRSLDNPLSKSGGFRVLWGNLAPDGAIIRTATASVELLSHEGPAIVFDNYEEMIKTIDDPSLCITSKNILVLRGCGPVGGPAMPEWGMIPIPSYLTRQGVTDMVRISDARMSGTSYGTVVLHVAPEAALGGPLALVKTGDIIKVDVERGRLKLLVDATELEQRRQQWKAPRFRDTRGWPYLYRAHVTQAPMGCDFDFLGAGDSAESGFVEPIIGRS